MQQTHAPCTVAIPMKLTDYGIGEIDVLIKLSPDIRSKIDHVCMELVPYHCLSF